MVSKTFLEQLRQAFPFFESPAIDFIAAKIQEKNYISDNIHVMCSLQIKRLFPEPYFLLDKTYRMYSAEIERLVFQYLYKDMIRLFIFYYVLGLRGWLDITYKGNDHDSV